MEKSGHVVLDSRFSKETSQSPEAVTRTSEGEHRQIALRRSALFRLLDQGFGGNAESLVQLPDHLQGKRAGAVENFINAIQAPQHRGQVFRGQPAPCET